MKFRLVLDGPRRAALNMAVDELLMDGVRRGQAPVLRFYRWDAPAVTAGYFEDIAKVGKRFGGRGKPVAAVRRITGGGSVLHGRDLTFSLCLRVPAPFFGADVKSSYLKINEAVRVGLKDGFPAIDYADCKSVPSQTSRQKERVCFDAPSCYDLLWNGKKILGGSQRRTHGVMLHQSTLFLPGAAQDLTPKIREGFERVWKISFEERPLSGVELADALKREEAIRADATRSYFPEGSFLREAIFLS